MKAAARLIKAAGYLGPKRVDEDEAALAAPAAPAADALPRLDDSALGCLVLLTEALERRGGFAGASGISCEGIYRRPGDTLRVRELTALCVDRAAWDAKRARLAAACAAPEASPHDLASTVKRVLREEAAPLLSYRLSPAFLAAGSAEQWRALLAELGRDFRVEFRALRLLVGHLRGVAAAASNRMDADAIATCVAPNLLREDERPPVDLKREGEKVKRSKALLRWLMESADDVFGAPEDGEEGGAGADPPEDPSGVAIVLKVSFSKRKAPPAAEDVRSACALYGAVVDVARRPDRPHVFVVGMAARAPAERILRDFAGGAFEVRGVRPKDLRDAGGLGAPAGGWGPRRRVGSTPPRPRTRRPTRPRPRRRLPGRRRAAAAPRRAAAVHRGDRGARRS